MKATQRKLAHEQNFVFDALAKFFSIFNAYLLLKNTHKTVQIQDGSAMCY